MKNLIFVAFTAVFTVCTVSCKKRSATYTQTYILTNGLTDSLTIYQKSASPNAPDVKLFTVQAKQSKTVATYTRLERQHGDRATRTYVTDDQQEVYGIVGTTTKITANSSEMNTSLYSVYYWKQTLNPDNDDEIYTLLIH